MRTKNKILPNRSKIVVGLSFASVAKVVTVVDDCGVVLLYAVELLVTITEGANVVDVVVVVVIVGFTFSPTGLSVGNFSYSGLMDGGNKIVVNVIGGCVVMVIAGRTLVRCSENYEINAFFSIFIHLLLLLMHTISNIIFTFLRRKKK